MGRPGGARRQSLGRGRRHLDRGRAAKGLERRLGEPFPPQRGDLQHELIEEVPREEVVHYGIARPRNGVSEVFELEDLVEKPDVADAPSNLAVAARYVFSPKIFHYLAETPPGKGNEIQLTDAIRMLIRDGNKMLGVRLPADHRRFDIGNFESYFEAFTEFALADPQYGPALRRFAEKLIRRPGEPGDRGTPGVPPCS